MVDALTDPAAQLDELATRPEAQGFRPYVIPVGGSNALGALGYVESALEIAQQCEGAVSLSSVVVASGSAGTHAGLAVGLEQLMPDVELIGVTVSRSVADQKPKVVTLQQAVAEQLALQAKAEILLWDDYFAPGYGTPMMKGWRPLSCWPASKVFCLTLSIPVRRWRALSTVSPASALRMKDPFCLFILAGRLRCLPIIPMSKNQVEK